MAESTPLEDIDSEKKKKKKKKKNKFGSFKAKVLNGHNGEEINETIKESIDNQNIVFTDKKRFLCGYCRFCRASYYGKKVQKKTTEETLKCVHIAISNAKRNLLGNYHKIKENTFNSISTNLSTN